MRFSPALRAILSRHHGLARLPRRCLVEGLESRDLLSAVLGQPIGNLVFAQDSGAESADLAQIFFDTNGQSDLSFTATSSNPSVLSASMSGSTITLTPEPGRSGFAIIRATAAAPDGSAASNSFRVQITASASRTLHVSLGPSRKLFSFAASNQASAIVTLKGPGTADVQMGGDALKLDGTSLHGVNQELESITLSGTTAASSLLITGHGTSRFALNIGNISSDGPLGTLQVKGATLLGDVSVPAGIHKLNVDSANSGSIDAGSSPTSVQGISFVDENFSSTGAVHSLMLGQWVDSDAVPETFSAASVGRLTTRGSFQPGVQITGELGAARIGGSIGGTWNVGRAATPISVGGNVAANFSGTFGALPGLTAKGDFGGSLTAPSIRSLRVASMTSATLNLTAASTTDLGVLTVARSVGFSSILTAGSIGKVTAGQLSNCRVFAGVSSPSLPATPSDFSSAATIGSITLRPSRGETISFDSARIAATSLGVLSLGTTRTGNGGFQYGVAAASIGRLTVKDTTHPQTIKLTAVHDAATLTSQLSAQKAQLGDLTFQIV
ncbi:MAG TPA: hypothetical protein VK797_23685 [Tepidisphaeraceae bacterium]|nr:hypothetical protein [Tepidisphaeraceae bacterium]